MVKIIYHFPHLFSQTRTAFSFAKSLVKRLRLFHTRTIFFQFRFNCEHETQKQQKCEIRRFDYYENLWLLITESLLFNTRKMITAAKRKHLGRKTIISHKSDTINSHRVIVNFLTKPTPRNLYSSIRCVN